MENQARLLLEDYEHVLYLKARELSLYSTKTLEELPELNNLLGVKSERHGDLWCHSINFSNLNAFVLRHALRGRLGKHTYISETTKELLAAAADQVELPRAELSEDGKAVILRAPRLKVYRDTFSKLEAYEVKEGYKLRLEKVLDLENLMRGWDSKLPPLAVAPEVKKLNHEPLVGFDGTLESLKNLPLSSLNLIKANGQTWKELKSSKATLEDKLQKLKIHNLYDLLFFLPRRYIDKSHPQAIDELIEGETATIVGKVVSFRSLNASVPGLSITVEDLSGRRISVTFWRQQWLQRKFNVGDPVLVMGSVGKFRDSLQLGGVAIEHFDESLTLPIIPIYKQSGSMGITSRLIMGAVRELLQRIGAVKLPIYLRSEGRMAYENVVKAIHFPETLEAYDQAVETLAYYELVYMQLLLEDFKHNVEHHPGLIQEGGDLQRQLQAVLPFKLTGSQVTAIRKLNKRLRAPEASTSLLMADVGAGKTLVAQMAAAQSIASGYQAVLVAPTEVLARQLYNNSSQLFGKLENGPQVVFLYGGLKVKEKKEILGKISSGEAKLIVATQAAFSSGLSFANLGLVIIDEQQKFGAEQRSQLLGAREDGRIPDLLLQTATPIPRSMAQMYYGDIEPLLMKEKPQGRLPIETFWLQEDPVTISEEPLHELWKDLRSEVAKGNQAFVITPMVVDSGKVDAASVEKTFKALSSKTLKDLRVGFVHGQMKLEAQRETMEKFRDKELDVLVASTVVEVGVDIPDATRMVILSAERLGASSLHQIRGRVGRNSKQSRCYLVSKATNPTAQERLNALVDHQDGFEIAKVDLKIRGEGTLFSRDQSGDSDMIFAKLSLHGELIASAREEALRILESPFQKEALAAAAEKFSVEERLL